jgi:hypothetical protein
MEADVSLWESERSVQAADLFRDLQCHFVLPLLSIRPFAGFEWDQQVHQAASGERRLLVDDVRELELLREV